MHRKGLVIGILILLMSVNIGSTFAGDADVKTMSPVGFDGNTLYVGGTGPNNYTTIQSAVSDAVDGDTVFVYDDSSPYYENIVVDKSINLIGEDKNSTIIDGVYGGIDLINLQAEDVSITEFTLQNSDMGIYTDTKNISFVISNNIIRNQGYAGIYIQWRGSGIKIVENNSIYSNDVAGIIASSSNCIIRNNILGLNGGGYEDCNIFVSGTQNIISGNIINNSESDGIVIDEGGSNSIISNVITNIQRGGIAIVKSGNNIIEDNVLSNIDGSPILATRRSNGNLFIGNTITESSSGILLFVSNNNDIIENNFLNNDKNAEFHMSFQNTWNNNFWDDPRNLPYPIFGYIGFGLLLQYLFYSIFGFTIATMINFDWNPAQEPNDIGV